MKRVLICLLLLLLFAYGAREALYMGVRMNKTGEYGKLNTIFLEHNTYDCLIIGSSRAESHFNTRIIDSIIGLNSFNAGLEGATMPFILGSLEAYLEHSDAPKYVILNLDIHSFSDNNDTIHRFPRYFPYLGNKKLYECLSERDHRFPWFKNIPFYSLPYFSDRYLDASARGYLSKPNEFDRSVYKGYAPVPAKMQQDVDTIKYKPFSSKPPEIVKKSLDRIFYICETKKSKLILVISPLYYKETQSIVNKDEIMDWLNKGCAEADLQLMNYVSSEICQDKEFFADPNHLNKPGSESFSRSFSVDVLKYLTK